MIVIYCIGFYLWMFATAFARVDRPDTSFIPCLLHGLLWPLSFAWWVFTGKIW